jgi:CDP-paratose 2-epimerase
MQVLVTGCSGLIGSEAVLHFAGKGHQVTGVDNNMRREFFGESGDTTGNLARVKRSVPNLDFHALDIRDRDGLGRLFSSTPFDAVVHCAAQPSHDKARDIPLLDFEVNAVGTLNLLEMTRLHSPKAAFVHMSTNKVYGDAPNEISLTELDTRYEYARSEDWHGVPEECRIDRCLHSLFGASKAAGDLVAQEYGRYFGLNVGVFRGGCLTGPAHAGVELHGFLSYLARVAVEGKPYRIFGYKGKQVRDQIHSADVVAAFEAFIQDPRPGEVYNLGGGRENSVSVLESIDLFQRLTGNDFPVSYVEQNRIGDHICYISDTRKLQSHYPGWRITRSLEQIFQELVDASRQALIEA